jgi:hypothetical protein
MTPELTVVGRRRGFCLGIFRSEAIQSSDLIQSQGRKTRDCGDTFRTHLVGGSPLDPAKLTPHPRTLKGAFGPKLQSIR